MSSLVRWEPFREMVTLRDAMDHLFEDSFTAPHSWTQNWAGTNLALDVYETKDDVVVKATLPGVKPEEVEITITGDVLTIRGQATEEKQVKDQNYIHRERRYGSFERTVRLPDGLKSDKADAEFENGVLTLRLPKSEESKPKTIKISAK
jgi:HSP20 family protein